jgi:hypothetical protein
MINKSTGVMESESSIKYIISKLLKEQKSGKKLIVEVVENSKHHNGENMLVICEDPGNDISIYHIEVSQEGVFAYEVDDGVS